MSGLDPKGFGGIWKDLLFIGTVAAGVWYAGALSRQIEVNTARLDRIETYGSPQVQIMAEQLKQNREQLVDLTKLMREHMQETNGARK
jgi:hypothetical protein